MLTIKIPFVRAKNKKVYRLDEAERVDPLPVQAYAYAYEYDRAIRWEKAELEDK